MEVLFMTPDQYQKHMDKIEEIKLRLQPSTKLMKDFIIDNDDFVSIMKIAARTAQRWYNRGKISFYQVGAKIYCTQDDIEIFLKKHYNESFANRRKTRNQTLWGAWAILGKSNKVFLSGDTGYFDELKKVGEKFGPFDLVFVENGQYNEDWASIHMMPEQSVLAASELKAKAVVPIHLGKFSLSIHAWDEPVKRFLSAAEKFAYQVYTPAPGEIMTFPWGKTTDWWTD